MPLSKSKGNMIEVHCPDCARKGHGIITNCTLCEGTGKVNAEPVKALNNNIDLKLLATDELQKELLKRYHTYVFIGYKTANMKDSAIQTVFTAGEFATIIGFCRIIEDKTLGEYRKENPIDEEDKS